MKHIGITECEIMKDDEIDENRYLDCADYDHCLSQAVKQNMRGFTCKGCHAFTEYLRAREEYVEYIIATRDRGKNIKKVVKRFCPGSVEIDTKNTGTMWND